MFKKSTLVVALGLGFAASSAFAGSTSGNFNVQVAITPQCQIYNGSGSTGTIGDVSLAYSSFQTSASTASTNFKVRCTNTLAYSLALDSASVTDGTTGLAYTLNLSTSATPSATANASLTGLAGNGNTGHTYYVHGNVAAGQDGTSTAGAANNARTLTISY